MPKRRTKKSQAPLEAYIPEIARHERDLRRERRERMAEEGANSLAPQGNQMAPQRTLMEYVRPGFNANQQGVTRPPVNANNFEIKPALLQMIQSSVQFYGLANEDPNAHIANFLEICDTFKYNGVSDDAIRLRLFPFTLKDRAKAWLNSLAPGSITTWDQLAQAFLAKYFPLAKTARIIKEITTFQQAEGESLYEAWERFKELQRSCPHHNLPRELLLQTFYNGVNHTTRGTIDAAAGGSLMRKTVDDAYDLLEEMANNNSLWAMERARAPIKEQKGVIALDPVMALQVEVAKLSKQLSDIKMGSSSQVSAIQTPCELCGQVGHFATNCFIGGDTMGEQVKFIGAQQGRGGNNPYSNTYNPGWRNHSNFSWSNN